MEACRALACRQQACRTDAGLPCEMLPVAVSRDRTTLWRPSGRWTLQAAGMQTWIWCAASWASCQAWVRCGSGVAAEVTQENASLLGSRGEQPWQLCSTLLVPLCSKYSESPMLLQVFSAITVQTAAACRVVHAAVQ